MKWHFFKERELPEQLAVYILSLLDPQSQAQAVLVNKNWRDFVKLTQRYIDLLPTIRSIPLFSQVTLDVLKLKLMAGGMTNTTYKVKIGSDYGKFLSQIHGVVPGLVAKNKNKKWVLRLPGEIALFSVDRKNEGYNAIQASQLNLNVPVAYFNENGIQVTKFIEGIQKIDQETLQREDLLIKLAAKAKILHSSKPFLNNTAVFERNRALLDRLKKRSFLFPQEVGSIDEKMNHMEHIFSSYQIDMVPCHNDSTPLNYILSYTDDEKEEVIHQIDWEYSSNNDFLWDLACFAVEAKLSQKQELIYLNAYFGKDNMTESVMSWFMVYKPIVEWWITLWSWTQLAFGANSVDASEYKNLGEERYENTLFHLNSDVLHNALHVIESGRVETDSLNYRGF